MRYLLPIVLLFVFTIAEAGPAVDHLIAHELSFAETAREEGTHKAFLTFLGEGSVIFRPFPVDGRKWYQDNPDSGGLLSWRPVYAEVSAAGDLGFTTGPWEFRSKPQEKPRAFGHYVSIWKQHSENQWTVILDAGVFYPEPPRLQGQDIEKQQARPIESQAQSGTDLLQLEKRLNDETKKAGIEALRKHFADNGFLLRNGMLPVRGQEAIAAHLASIHGAWNFSTGGSGVSEDGTLGYTYGTYEATGSFPGKGSYLRIWRKEDGWKIALDLAAPAN